jgi:hypothetical protein
MMKRWKTILALLALVALLLPCAHAAGHQHDECAAETVCVEPQATCHACTEVSCSEKISIPPLNNSSPVEPPIRQLFTVYTLRVNERAVPFVLLSAGTLISLRTVQLLI